MFCRGRDFATFSQKNSNCHIQNRLGAPFVACEFTWGIVLSKYAVISLDKQNNDRKVSDCLSLTRNCQFYMSQVMSCLFTIHIDELVGLEVPMHKR